MLNVKLFEEIKNTDTLRLVNEKVVRRICKLVTLNKWNPGSGDGKQCISIGGLSVVSLSTGNTKNKENVIPKKKK